MRQAISKGCVFAVVACLGAALSACSPSGEESSEAFEEITTVLNTDISSFDPHTEVPEAGPDQLWDALYDTLVRTNFQDPSSVKPALAESWEVNSTSVVFKLKSDLKCTDGSDLNAEGIARSLERISDPETGAIWASRVFGPGGAKTISADNEQNTIRVELNEPYADLLFGMTRGHIICPSALDDPSVLSESPAETGPYKLEDARRGDRYVLARIDESNAVEELDQMPKKITMRYVEDNTTRTNLVETGDVDISLIRGRDIDRLNSQFDSVKTTFSVPEGLLFNQQAGRPTTDIKVRTAIAQAVNIDDYTQAATFGHGEPSNTVYSPRMACYDETNAQFAQKFDLDVAKATLSEAGYGESGKKLKLKIVSLDNQNAGPEYVADAMRKLGADVEFTQGTMEQMIDAAVSGDWDIMVYPFDSPQARPYNLVVQFSDLVPGLNVGGVQNEQYNDLALQASGLEDLDEACVLWSKAEQALLERVDTKPLTLPNVNWFHQKGITFEADSVNVDTRTIRRTSK